MDGQILPGEPGSGDSLPVLGCLLLGNPLGAGVWLALTPELDCDPVLLWQLQLLLPQWDEAASPSLGGLGPLTPRHRGFCRQTGGRVPSTEEARSSPARPGLCSSGRLSAWPERGAPSWPWGSGGGVGRGCPGEGLVEGRASAAGPSQGVLSLAQARVKGYFLPRQGLHQLLGATGLACILSNLLAPCQGHRGPALGIRAPLQEEGVLGSKPA